MPYDGINGTTEFEGHAADKIRTLRALQICGFDVGSFCANFGQLETFEFYVPGPLKSLPPQCGMNSQLIGKAI